MDRGGTLLHNSDTAINTNLECASCASDRLDEKHVDTDEQHAQLSQPVGAAASSSSSSSSSSSAWKPLLPPGEPASNAPPIEPIKAVHVSRLRAAKQIEKTDWAKRQHKQAHIDGALRRVEALQRQGLEKDKAVQNVSKEFGMGKSTLYRHLSRKKKGITVNSRGRPPLHTPEEELELKAWVLMRQAGSTTPSRGEINMASTRLLAVRGLKPVQSMRSSNWFQRFKRNAPELGMRNSTPLERQRAMSATPQAVHQFHTDLEFALKTLQVKSIFNFDETGVVLWGESSAHKVR